MKRRFPLLALCVLLSVSLLAPSSGVGQERPGENAGEAEQSALRIPKPDLQDLEQIRFVTDSDYPPFNYLDEEGELTGFNVDLARALCDELSVECSVRAVPWNRLLPALEEGEADAVIASNRISEEILRKVDFTDSYYHTPARFVALKANPVVEITPESLTGKKIGVVVKTAHQAYLKDFFTGSAVVSYDTSEEAKSALREGKVDFLFGDGVSLMFWLNGISSDGCCEFRGGPFTESRYFGEGIAIAIPKGNRKLRDALNYGLHLARSGGRIEELHLRYFPLSFF
ncbi:MAG TPA: transporter substrate-binding domain-containing protein [Rhizobiales bacterium]|nr:putative ABC transporter arginine-binding protein 2 precursor [bacterium BMS3Bbin10]HDO52435.1 transporter substrate-binding domain-containing protein [Hyphomicrobiales bacterium]